MARWRLITYATVGFHKQLDFYFIHSRDVPLHSQGCFPLRTCFV